MNYLAIMFSIIGFIVSYIIYKNNINKMHKMCPRKGGCNLVTKGKYSKIFGFQNELLGMMFYAVLLITLPLAEIDINIKSFAQTLSIFGLGFSLYFVFLQAFVIKSWCRFCIISALCSIIIFISLLKTLIF